MTQLTDHMKEMISSDTTTTLNVRNIDSCIYQFYELKKPYMMTLEIINQEKDYFDYSMIAPSLFFHERASISQNFDLQTRGLHQHNFFELMFVLKGTVIQHIENQHYTYHAGQCCLLNHNVNHLEEGCDQSSELLFLMMSDSFLLNLINNDIIYDEMGNAVTNPNPIYEFIQESQKKSSYSQKQYWDFLPISPSELFISDFEQLFGEILLETRYRKAGLLPTVQGLLSTVFEKLMDPTLYNVRRITPRNDKNEYLFTQLQKIMEKTNGRISRKELEELFHYDSHYLNRLVKSMTGKTLLEYGRIFCLKEAARLLTQTDEDITSIINQLGLSNRSYFYRIFKVQYGITPNEYRQRNRFHSSGDSFL